MSTRALAQRANWRHRDVPHRDRAGNDGRWIAEVGDLPGVMAYGVTRPDAVAKVQALALRALAERLEHGEAVPELLNVSFHAA